MKNKLAVLAVVVGLFMVSVSMFAHHSAAIYDREHPVTLQGTATNLAFINPHVQVHFEVKDENGNVVKWVAGSDPPQRVYRAGWNKATLKTGDQITITCAPAKDGRKICLLMNLVGPTGKVYTRGAE